MIKVDGNFYHTKPCKVIPIQEPTSLDERVPPIRFRKSIPTSWIEIMITEGKNRQIRKMCASVGFPVLRIVRVKIGSMDIQDMKPGSVINLEKSFL